MFDLMYNTHIFLSSHKLCEPLRYYRTVEFQPADFTMETFCCIHENKFKWLILTNSRNQIGSIVQ